MKRIFLSTLAATLALCSTLCGRNMPKQQLYMTVELTDGSSLVAKPLDQSLAVKLDFGEVNVPFEQVKSLEVQQKGEHVVILLKNGDKITGTPRVGQLKLDTLLGQLSPAFAQIEHVTFAIGAKWPSPADKGALWFDGLNWLPWKTMFEIQGDKLATLPKARAGFKYGHDGNGRGPTLMANIGDSDWKDYAIEVEYCVTGVDSSFNPYQLPSDYGDGVICFHVADAKESWNERGASMYTLNVQGDGAWSLQCDYNSYCRAACGYANYGADGERKLASGDGLKIDRENGNKYRIEVRGQNIQIWVDGERIANVTDEKMGDTIGGQTLDHGGVGFQWGMDAMGWIRNFSYKPL